MKQFSLIIFGFLLAFGSFAQGQKVVVLNLDDPIYPSTAEYINNGLHRAVEERASCVVIKINTPGGLLKPTRDMVGEIMSSPIPIVSFVAPSGAHAGSAGAFIALASDITAMSPGSDRKSTRLNSSHVRISYAVF